MATRVVLYARVSPSGELRNPSAQLRTLRSWADERSWQVVAEFSDHVSGDPARRSAAPPGLCGALGMLQRGEADLLLVVALDRLVRSAAGILELVQDVQSWGGRVASYQDGDVLDAMSDVGELLLFVRGWMARMELKLIRTRTKEGMAAARARGVKIGRPRIEEPRAEEARRLRAQGLTYGQIAERLGTTQMRVRRALGYLYPKERLKHPPPAS